MTPAAELVATTVRDWANQMDIPPSAPVDTAAQLAADLFREGATVLEACGAARGFLRSWLSHPSRGEASLRSGPVARVNSPAA